LFSSHVAGEHAAELEGFELALHLLQLAGDFVGGAVILFSLGHFQQFLGVADAVAQLVEGGDDAVQPGLFLVQVLGAFGVVPDCRLFQFAFDFGQSLFLGVVVKDTPKRFSARFQVTNGLNDGIGFHA